MKTIKVTLALLMLALAMTIGGCAKDSATTPSDPGTTRDSFIGRWSVTENYTKFAYEVTISADPGSANGVLIAGFGNTLPTGPAAGAVVSGSKITLDANLQIDGLKFVGSGTLSGTKINWNYTVDDGANLLHSIAVYTKK
ncbi:MAG: hypothetical protein WCK34_17180 [Bacteroidota bacterium]